MNDIKEIPVYEENEIDKRLSNLENSYLAHNHDGRNSPELFSGFGNIGGWKIQSQSLKSGDGNTTVGIDAGGTNPAFYAGNATPASAPFRVTQAGALTATDATLTGSLTTSNITATGGTIGGFDITSTLIRSATLGARVQLNQTDAAVQALDSSGVKRSALTNQRLEIYNSSGSQVGFVENAGPGLEMDTTTGNGILLSTGGTGQGIAFSIGGTNTELNITAANLTARARFDPQTDATYDQGTSSSQWKDIYISNRLKIGNVAQPKIFTGYVNSGGTSGTPFPSGWSSSNTATGKYTITHSLNTTNYVVTLQPLNANSLVANVLARNSTTFTLDIWNYTSNAYNNSDFMFVLFQT